VQLGHHDLGEGLRRTDLRRKLVERDAPLVLDQAEHVDARAGHAGADLHPVADRPEPEQPDAVLPGDDQAVTLLGAEAALSRAADVRRDVAQRLVALEAGEDALSVVPDRDRRTATHPPPGDDDVAGVRVDRVLHQLGDRLAWVRLRPRQPADEIERVGRTEHQGARGRLGHWDSVARTPAGASSPSKRMRATIALAHCPLESGAVVHNAIRVRRTAFHSGFSVGSVDRRKYRK
jgi:hypothetical protein